MAFIFVLKVGNLGTGALKLKLILSKLGNLVTIWKPPRLLKPGLCAILANHFTYALHQLLYYLLNRNDFIQHTGIITAGLALLQLKALAPPQEHSTANKLLRWKGFNLLDFFSPARATMRNATTEEH